MNNEKTFICDNEKDERLFKINEGLLYLIAAAVIIVNVYVFAFLGCILFKTLGLGKFWVKAGGYAGVVAGLIFTGILSNVIRNWQVRRLEKIESKKIKDEMARG